MEFIDCRGPKEIPKQFINELKISISVNVYFRSRCSNVCITAYNKNMMIAYCSFVIIREVHPFLVEPSPQ